MGFKNTLLESLICFDMCDLHKVLACKSKSSITIWFGFNNNSQPK